jgi:putative addiction module killer protein
MIQIIQSDEFRKWLSSLRDKQAKARILVRLGRIRSGNLGDVKPIGDGISEARIHTGPGYRLYFIQRGNELIIMLAGSDKKSQDSMIKQAYKLAEKWR